MSRDGKQASPFYFSEVLPKEKARTWQVDRAEFDQMMLDHARENGVTVWEDAHVDRVQFDGSRAVGAVVTRNHQHQLHVTSKVVIDASGRSSILGRQLGLKSELPDLRKSSIWGYYAGAERPPGIDAGETTIFLLPEGGWFWFIPLPNDIASVGVVADTDKLLAKAPHHEIAFQQALERCPWLMKRLENSRMTGRIRGMNQLAYVNRKTSGDGWVMLGDARAFLDPIYSSGMLLALASAHMAAERIDHGLRTGDLSGANLGSFEPILTAGVNVIRQLIHAFYDPEFSFPRFLKQFPTQRSALIDCLIGDVFKDMEAFSAALASMTSPPVLPELMFKHVARS